MKYAVSPSGEEALRIANSRKPGSLLLIIGECRVRFKGRAEAFLDYGERLVMLKRDGSVLVHRGDGCDAVNWQPPGTRTTFFLDEEGLVLHAYRSKPPEKLKIRFRKVKLIANLRMRDKAELRLTGMEKDYADRVEENPWIIEEGLRVIRRERRTDSGSIDIYARDKDNIPVILEVKRGVAGVAAVYQLEAYVNDFKRKNRAAKVRGILCAPRIPPMVQNMLRERGFEYRAYSCRFELGDEKQSTLLDYGHE
jgi:hypothetical protein